MFFFVVQPFIPQLTKNGPPAVGHAEDVSIVEQKLEKVDSVVNSNAVTTTEVPSPARNEPATVQQASEVTSEPSAAPAADPQPTDPSQEEVTVEVPSNNETPSSDNDTAAAPEIAQSEPEVSEPVVNVDEAPVNSEDSNSGESAKDLTVSTETAVQEVQETSSVADAPVDESATAAAGQPTGDSIPAISGALDEGTGEKSEVKAESVPENKPTESEVNGKSRTEFINIWKNIIRKRALACITLY